MVGGTKDVDGSGAGWMAKLGGEGLRIWGEVCRLGKARELGSVSDTENTCRNFMIDDSLTVFADNVDAKLLIEFV